ncbi:hypothetical protein G6L37_05700 [Agrobacterium rubi]|nr:hypothetical protein [Agrobacterium rubi]NTF24853.1 hypothetical protein [Agrobacterium rubi]
MSTSGSELYRKISGLRSELETDIARRTERSLDLGNKARQLLSRQAELWTSLAAIHLDLGFDLPKEIKALVEKRKGRLESQQEIVSSGDIRVRELMTQHKAREDEMRAAQQDFDDHEAVLAAAFEADTTAVALTVTVNELKVTVESKQERFNRVDAECDAKSAAYENDELFQYLRKRAFGTPEYHATGLVARLDHWISRLVNYDKASSDYDHLQKIPGWHRDDLEDVKQRLSVEADKLAAIHEAAFKSLVPFKDRLRAAGKALDAAAEAISREHSQIATAQRTLSEASLAQDDDLKKIKRELAAALERVNIRDLQELAARTATIEDDEIVRKIIQNRNDIADVESQSNSIAREVAMLKSRAGDFEAIETKMRRKDWHHSDHRFNDGVDSHLSSMLAGALTADAVWSVMSRSHRDPPPSYSETVSSSPWPSSSGSSWNSSSSSSSSSNDSWGSSSTSSSDYNTGGGGGGGDYSTGGGG